MNTIMYDWNVWFCHTFSIATVYNTRFHDIPARVGGKTHPPCWKQKKGFLFHSKDFCLTGFYVVDLMALFSSDLQVGEAVKHLRAQAWRRGCFCPLWWGGGSLVGQAGLPALSAHWLTWVKNTQPEPEASFEWISYVVLSLSLNWNKFFNNTYLFLIQK